jgi:hypothetical protein
MSFQYCCFTKNDIGRSYLSLRKISTFSKVGQKSMFKINNSGKTCFIIIFCFFCSVASASSGSSAIDVKFEGSTISAVLEDAPLGQILKMVVREKGIWLNWKQSLYDERISIRFNDIPLAEGLSRILSNINYAFIFNKDKHLVGLIILGKKGSDASFTHGRVSRNPFEKSTKQPSLENPESESGEIVKGKQFPRTEDQDADTTNGLLFGVSLPPVNSGSSIEILPH